MPKSANGERGKRIETLASEDNVTCTFVNEHILYILNYMPVHVHILFGLSFCLTVSLLSSLTLA